MYFESMDVNIFQTELCLVGVKSGAVRDRDMTASSVYSLYHAHEGRLDRTDPSKSWIPAIQKLRKPTAYVATETCFTVHILASTF